MGYDGRIPAFHYGAVDVDLEEGPGVIYWILVQGAGASATLEVRDGSDDGADVMLTLEVQAQRAVLFKFNPPAPYKKGLYLDPGTNVNSFAVCYDRLE